MIDDTDLAVQGRFGGFRGFPGGFRGGFRGFPGGFRGFPGRFGRFPRFRRFPRRFFPFFPFFPSFIGPAFPSCFAFDRFGRCISPYDFDYDFDDFGFPVTAGMDDDTDDDYFV